MSNTADLTPAAVMTAEFEIDLDRLALVLDDSLGISLHATASEATFGVIDHPEVLVGHKGIEEVNALLDRLRRLRFSEALGFALVSDFSAEIVVDDSSGRVPLRMRLRQGLRLENEAEGLIYEVGNPSPEFAIAFATKVSELPQRDRGVVGHRWYRSVLGGELPVDPFELISQQCKFTTVRVTSTRKRAEKEWQSLAESLYFHLGYNLDLALVPRQSLPDVLRTSRVQRMRRGRMDELDAPRRSYDPTLVRSYQVGVGSESAMLAYLSFYHIAEHWFEDVFLDDVAERVQNAITSPDFSARRKKDLRNVITTVSKSLRTRDETVVISELTALELTLRKYIDLNELRNVINEYDPDLLEYYGSHAVGFSGGDALDLTDSPSAKLFKRLAQRIYKTRNALVHRKDGDKSRFTPLKDDRVLRREIPLIRFVAEQIIVGSSNVL